MPQDWIVNHKINALVRFSPKRPADMPASVPFVNDLASTQDPSRGVAVALTRQLIRAAIWRRDTFEHRRPPELVTPPDAAISDALGRVTGAGARDELPAAELAGTVDGAAFSGLRDLDDRTSGVLEVLTSTGKYIWIPLSAIVALRPQRPARLRDLVWRAAELEVAGGPSGIVYLPAIYHASAGEGTNDRRLGRTTDWVEEEGGVRGLGLRGWLIGDESAVSIDVQARIDSLLEIQAVDRGGGS